MMCQCHGYPYFTLCHSGAYYDDGHHVPAYSKSSHDHQVLHASGFQSQLTVQGLPQ